MLEGRGIAIEQAGHRTWLKWHRGHRFAGDISFTGERIVEGLELGASVEIDLVRFAGDGFVVLHDETLNAATTGSGPVREASEVYLRDLHLRDPFGAPSRHRVMLLDDLGRLLAQVSRSRKAGLQLDLKETSYAIRDRDVAAFAAAISQVADKVILSGGDSVAVARLSEALPDMAIGYDPCHDGAIERLMETHDFTGFVAGAVRAVARAQMIYLDRRLVLYADQAEYDLIGAFHEAGRLVDAYTIKSSVPSVLPTVRRLLELKADQITTDDPVGLERLLMEDQT
ncbi:glycerophosphodiester phosphodiesterase [Rhizobium cauense]|uniref:glycerophosphodiester phosphodiesterase n=1 Tax=Rhizobium cauense TaxID=1166683 RepID=UPI001C6E84CA|nr:glycerophosphodiester phosphodiesterase family protein [Rhizobium cauense]MBW9114062.1 glycerophosphodiester phosphodiesterase [Rhizobium cauense]